MHKALKVFFRKRCYGWTTSTLQGHDNKRGNMTLWVGRVRIPPEEQFEFSSLFDSWLKIYSLPIGFSIQLHKLQESVYRWPDPRWWQHSLRWTSRKHADHIVPTVIQDLSIGRFFSVPWSLARPIRSALYVTEPLFGFCNLIVLKLTLPLIYIYDIMIPRYLSKSYTSQPLENIKVHEMIKIYCFSFWWLYNNARSLMFSWLNDDLFYMLSNTPIIWLFPYLGIPRIQLVQNTHVLEWNSERAEI